LAQADGRVKTALGKQTAAMNTFPEVLEAFRTAISYRFVEWLNQNRDVLITYKASLGFVWA